MNESASHECKGLFASLSRLGVTLVAIMHTRLQLLAIDLEEDSVHFFRVAKLTLMMLFCFGIGIILLTILITVFFWDSHRILVLSLLSGFFVLSGLVIRRYTRHTIQQKPTLFASSLSELVKDWQSLDIHARDLS